jgi:spermidine/putrescine transport system substrate-binding protein
MRFLCVILAGLALSACTKNSEKTPTQASPGGGVVHMATWSNYISEEAFAAFTQETGIQVKVSNYSSNEELLAKLQAGASGYDVAVPSDYMVFAMIQLQLLLPLDVQKIPNRKGVDPRYLGKQYDPESKFSLPWNWGTTGIAVNRKLYKGKIKSWKDLFTQADLAGQFTLLDDAREVMGASLKSLGYSLNSTQPEEIEKAKVQLAAIKSRVKAFTSEAKVPMEQGEVAVAHIYMSDALQAARSAGSHIEYLIPEEGATLWIDNLVVPKGAANVDGAHRLINFLLKPEIAAKTVKAVLVAPTLQGIGQYLDPSLRTNPVIFPAPASMKRLEMMHDLGDALRLYDRAWTEIKAGQ